MITWYVKNMEDIIMCVGNNTKHMIVKKKIVLGITLCFTSLTFSIPSVKMYEITIHSCIEGQRSIFTNTI